MELFIEGIGPKLRWVDEMNANLEEVFAQIEDTRNRVKWRSEIVMPDSEMDSENANCMFEGSYPDTFCFLKPVGRSQDDPNLTTKGEQLSTYDWNTEPLPYPMEDDPFMPYLDNIQNFNFNDFDFDLDTPQLSDTSPSSSDSGNHSPPAFFNAISPFPCKALPIEEAVQKYGLLQTDQRDCAKTHADCHAFQNLPLTSARMERNVPSAPHSNSTQISFSSVTEPSFQHLPQCVTPSLQTQTVQENHVTAPKYRKLLPREERKTVTAAPPRIVPIAHAVTVPTSIPAISLQYVRVNNVTSVPILKSPRVSSEDFEQKQIYRRMRNRAYSQLSRVRKRNEYEQMKQNLAAKEELIKQLRDENTALKKTIETLQNENAALRRNSMNWGSLATGAAVMLTIITMASLSGTNLRYSGISDNAKIERIKRDTSVVVADNARGKYSISKQPVFSEVRNRTYITERFRSGNISYDCYGFEKIYLNQTETIKLNKDVFDWVNRHEGLNFLQFCRIFRAPLYKESQSKEITLGMNLTRNSMKKRSRDVSRRKRTTDDKREAAIEKAARERAWRHIDIISTTNKVNKENSEPVGIAATVFDKSNPEQRDYSIRWSKPSQDLTAVSAESKYIELTQSLRQREDTLYVVAMKSYYLLPPSNRNSTMRPRLAVILPALSYNGTLPDQIAMMRIECDITGTGLFHLSNTLLPLFYEQPYQV